MSRPFLLFIAGLICAGISHPLRGQSASDYEALKPILAAKNAQLIQAAKRQSFALIKGLYRPDALLMAEYHPLMDEPAEIEHYYKSIFERQALAHYSRETIEVLHFANWVMEMGLFRKELTDGTVLRGKYINVWARADDGDLALKAEGFGYLHQIEDPTPLIVSGITDTATPLLPRPGVVIPREMQAYSAYNRSSVMDRIPEKSATGYTEDAAYFPYADTLKRGRATLIKHFEGYYAYPVKIDSIQTWTYDLDEVSDGYIRYGKFYVDWSVPDFSGNTQGFGISYWKRLPDRSLRIHRQIGMHIHQE